MIDLPLLSILATMIAVYAVAMRVSKFSSERYDEILCGIAKGNPMSLRHRWMMLLTNWLPWAFFLVDWLIVMCLGFVQLSRGAEPALS